MHRLVAFAAIYSLAGCAAAPTTPIGPGYEQPVTPAAIGGVSPLQRSALRPIQTIVLKGPDARTGPFVRTPDGWTHAFEPGEDTQRHYVREGDASIAFEYWTLLPTYACRNFTCGRRQISINGANAILSGWQEPEASLA